MEKPWEQFLWRLGVRLPDRPDADGDREPLSLDHLQSWHVGDSWLQRRLANENESDLIASLRREGKLPAGSLGLTKIDWARMEGEPLVRQARARGVDVGAAQTPVRVEIGGLRISGRIAGRTDQGLRRATFSRLAGKRVPRLWLDHLLLCAEIAGSAGPAILVGRSENDCPIVLKAVDQETARKHLADIVDLYRLSRVFPLPFFPDCVGKMIECLHEEGIDFLDDNHMANLKNKAEDEYKHQVHGTPAAKLPSVRVAFAGRDPLDMTCSAVLGLEEHRDRTVFLHLIEKICGPMVEHLESL